MPFIGFQHPTFLLWLRNVLSQQKLPAPEALNKAVIADGLRDMQGLAARFFGGRSAAEPGVARTKAEQHSIGLQPQKAESLKPKAYRLGWPTGKTILTTY